MAKDSTHPTETRLTAPADRSGLGVGIVRLVLGRALSVGLNLAGWALMARALGPQSFGLVQFAISVVFYLSFITDLGLTTLGTREFARHPRPATVVHAVVGLRLLLAVIATLLGLIVAIVAPMAADQRSVALIVGATIAAGALNMLWLLRAQGRSSAIALQDVTSAFALVAGAALVVLATESPVAAAAVYATTQWVAAILSLQAIGGPAVLRPTLRRATSTLRSALPLGVAVLAVNLYYSADSVLLGVLRSTEEVGIYGAAYRLVMPWLMLASVVGLLAMPTLARLAHQDRDATETLRGLSRSLLGLGLPIAVATTLAADQLIFIVFGPDFAAAALPLAILIWSCATVYANAPFGFLLIARRQDRAYMWIAVAGAAVNLTLNAVLIPLHGVLGAATATIAAEIVVLSAMVWLTRDISLPILSRTLPPALGTAVAVGLAVWPVRSSALSIPVAMLAFGAVGFATGAIPARQLITALRTIATSLGRPAS